MASIVVINGRHRGEWYSIPATPRGLVVGRSDQLLAEIIDPRVSSQHMRIFKNDESGLLTLEDLDSRNGTRVNGKSVNKKDLSEGDLIQIGHTLLGFTEEDVPEDPEKLEALIDAFRGKAGPTLEQVEKREEYTEAAALFSRIFRRPGSGGEKDKKDRDRKKRR